MFHRPAPLSLFAFVGFALASQGCSLHVEHPRIRVVDLHVADVRSEGLVVRVGLAAYNPNGFELPLRDLDATLTIGADRAPAHVEHLAATLPPMRDVPVTVDVTFPWRSLPSTLQSARSEPALAYHLEGHITVHHYLDVRARFARDGLVPREELQSRAINSVVGRLFH